MTMHARVADHRKSIGQAQATTVDHGPATLPELFERQVRRNPNAIAAAFQDTVVTYGELNARANRLAHLLIARGVGPEDLVALALPRSVELLAAVLGALKAGAGYVPIDPAYPADRINFMVADASPACLVTAAGIPDGRLDTASVRVARTLVLGAASTEEQLTAQPKNDPDDAARSHPLRPLHPAYVIYTSGSTGRPKGVLVPHRNVVRLLTRTNDWFGFSQSDVWTLFHSYAFDFSV
jgi:nonribosomal peptide synthetase DhbF